MGLLHRVLAVRGGRLFGLASLALLLRGPPTIAHPPLLEGRPLAPHAQVVEVVQSSWGPGASGRGTPSTALGPASSHKAASLRVRPSPGPLPCLEFSLAPPLPPESPPPTDPQHQGTSAPAQIGGHQVGHLWPRPRLLAPSDNYVFFALPYIAYFLNSASLLQPNKLRLHLLCFWQTVYLSHITRNLPRL